MASFTDSLQVHACAWSSSPHSSMFFPLLSLLTELKWDLMQVSVLLTAACLEAFWWWLKVICLHRATGCQSCEHNYTVWERRSCWMWVARDYLKPIANCLQMSGCVWSMSGRLLSRKDVVGLLACLDKYWVLIYWSMFSFSVLHRYYSATILQMSGVRDDRLAIWLAGLTTLTNFLFTLLGVWLVERVGRRKLTLGSIIGEAARKK